VIGRLDRRAASIAPSALVKKYQNGVIPAKAGIQNTRAAPQPPHWIPAFAGMTGMGYCKRFGCGYAALCSSVYPWRQVPNPC